MQFLSLSFSWYLLFSHACTYICIICIKDIHANKKLTLVTRATSFPPLGIFLYTIWARPRKVLTGVLAGGPFALQQRNFAPICFISHYDRSFFRLIIRNCVSTRLTRVCTHILYFAFHILSFIIIKQDRISRVFYKKQNSGNENDKEFQFRHWNSVLALRRLLERS